MYHVNALLTTPPLNVTLEIIFILREWDYIVLPSLNPPPFFFCFLLYFSFPLLSLPVLLPPPLIFFLIFLRPLICTGLPCDKVNNQGPHTESERDKCAAKRVVSRDIHECLLWAGVMQLMPCAANLLQTHVSAQIIDTEDASNCSEQLQDRSQRKIENSDCCESPASHHFARIFSSTFTASTATSSSTPTPTSASYTINPRFTVVLGGTVRLEKFVALDNLIDLVRHHDMSYHITTYHNMRYYITICHAISYNIVSHNVYLEKLSHFFIL